ncbi:hypothetical protein [Xanthobacter autotrophicus]|uniref:hypothetical protein n=1 Tax=Xanthobacter autotrophicus TaxID=280 RepID=UPI00372C6D0B
MVDKLDFTFELSPLPAEKDVSLAEAMQFLRYGGIPRFRRTGSGQSSQIDDGFLSQTEDGHYRFRFADSNMVLNGPHVLDIAKAGSLFSLGNDVMPDPEARVAKEDRYRRRLARYETAEIEFAEAKARHERAIEAHRQWQVRKDEHTRQIAAWEASGKVGPKPECEREPAIPNSPMAPTPPAKFDTNSLPTVWQAEMERRETELQVRLNEAARSGKFRMWGVQVDEPLCDERSPEDAQGEQEVIPADYFRSGPVANGRSARNRYFDSETDRLHAVPLHLPEVADREILAYADNPSTSARFRSYSNVCVDREGLLALAAEIAPELVQDDNVIAEDSGDLEIESNGTKPAKVGPKPKFDWPAFKQAAREIIAREGGINPKIDPGPSGFKQSDLQRELADWCLTTWKVEPSPESIRKHLKQVLLETQQSQHS